jgi:hypothetical protein
MTTRLDANTVQLDISKYAAGSYFIKIPTPSGQVVKQIVIQD